MASGASSETRVQRAAAGREARQRASRSANGASPAVADRPDPIALLEQQAATRVPELVPIRYGRMLASPFAFFRGAAFVMASDLSTLQSSGLAVQLCGDAHLSNFGAFASPERELLFDVNDFDETLPGPFEWDLKRLAASLAVAGRERNFSAAQRGRVIRAAVRSYREAMRDFAAATDLEVWYAHLDAEEIRRRWEASATSRQRAGLASEAAKARTKDNLRALAKLTRTVDGELRIISDPPLIVPIDELETAGDGERAQERERIVESVREMLRAYSASLPDDRRALLERYHYVDLAQKVVGVGSVGMRAWIVLLVGSDAADPLFLQAKEADSSVLEPFLGASRLSSHGRRVVEGQRLMQAASDIFLGWVRAAGLDGEPRDFYVRQLWDSKRSADIDAMAPRDMQIYSEMCGWTLARAHARSGDRIAIAAYVGSGDGLDRALHDFAEAYADLNERDYAALGEAVDSGRVAARTGV
jgi:uncharacterized protein (DUF2252 family)